MPAKSHKSGLKNKLLYAVILLAVSNTLLLAQSLRQQNNLVAEINVTQVEPQIYSQIEPFIKFELNTKKYSNLTLTDNKPLPPDIKINVQDLDNNNKNSKVLKRLLTGYGITHIKSDSNKPNSYYGYLKYNQQQSPSQDSINSVATKMSKRKAHFVSVEPSTLNINTPFEFTIQELVPGFDYKTFFNQNNNTQAKETTFGNYVNVQTENGDLYMGFGNVPNGENGAAVFKYNNNEISFIGKLYEQGVNRMYSKNDTVYIPGTDPTASWDYGNFYKIENSVFTMYRNILKDNNGNPILDQNGNQIPIGLERVLHGMGVAFTNSNEIYHVGSTDKYIECNNPNFDNLCALKLFKSTDNATTWSYLGPYVTGHIQSLNGNLFGLTSKQGEVTNTYNIGIVKTDLNTNESQEVTLPEIFNSQGSNWNFFEHNNKLLAIGPKTAKNSLGSVMYVVQDINDISTITLPFSFATSGFYSTYNNFAVVNNYLYTITQQGELVRTNDPQYKKWEVLFNTNKRFINISYYSKENTLVLGEYGGSGNVWKIQLPEANQEVSPLYYLQTTSINGLVTFQNHSQQNYPITIMFYQQGSNLPTYTFNTTPTPEGNFQLQGIKLGTYEVAIKKENSLQAVKLVDLSNPENPNIDFGELIMGDINNDNLVSALDFIPLQEHFNTQQGDQNYYPQADLNGDNKISTQDFSILASNINKQGQYPSAVTPPKIKSEILGIYKMQGTNIFDKELVVTVYNTNTERAYYYKPSILSNGTFVITGIEPGDYQIAIKSEGFLQSIVTQELVQGVNQIVFPELLAGDVNFDNVVSVTDKTIIGLAFNGTKGQENYDSSADINNDGIINTADLSLMANNFGKAGDFLSFESPPGSVDTQDSSKLIGKINLQSLENNNIQTKVTLFSQDTGEQVEEYLTYTSSNGYFVINNVPVGTYQVGVKPANFLQRVQQNVVINENTESTVEFQTLLAGDANNDNKISQPEDVEILQSAYNSTINNSNYNAMADLNLDWVVSVQDFSLLAENMGTTGEEPIKE